MRWRWLVRYWFAAGRDSWRVFQGNAPPEERGRLLAEGARTVAATGTSVLRAFLFRDRSAYPHPQNFLFEVTSRHVVALGALRERLARSGEGAPP